MRERAHHHPDCYDDALPRISLTNLIRRPHECVQAIAGLVHAVRTNPACIPFVGVESDASDFYAILDMHAREHREQTPWRIAWGLAEMAFNDLSRAACEPQQQRVRIVADDASIAA